MTELPEPIEFQCRETGCVFCGTVSNLKDLEQIIRAAKVHDHNLTLDWGERSEEP